MAGVAEGGVIIEVGKDYVFGTGGKKYTGRLLAIETVGILHSHDAWYDFLMPFNIGTKETPLIRPIRIRFNVDAIDWIRYPIRKVNPEARIGTSNRFSLPNRRMEAERGYEQEDYDYDPNER